VTLRGRFVVLEGIDGCGSTSQAERLAAAVRDRGLPVRLTCEPTDGPIGALIRDLLRKKVQRPFGWPALALLFTADRHDHVDSLITPALLAGAVVVSDRYALSTVAYQCALAEDPELAAAWLRELNARVPAPDVTVVLDVRPEVAEARRASRGGSPELFETRELQRRLAALYDRAEQLVPGHRLVHVPGEGSLDEVAAQVLAAALPVLG